MLMCCVLLLEFSIQVVSNKIELVLSWYNVGLQSYPCWFRKILVHKKCDKTSFAATNSASLELLIYISSASLKCFELILYPCLIHVTWRIPRKNVTKTDVYCINSFIFLNFLQIFVPGLEILFCINCYILVYIFKYRTSTRINSWIEIYLYCFYSNNLCNNNKK